jgi:hypothetical protein
MTPVELLVIPDGLTDSVVSSIEKTTGLSPANPLPLMATLSPETPLEGVSVTFGPRENTPVAEPPLSEACTTWLPRVPEGAVNMQAKLPLASVLMASELVIRIKPSILMLMLFDPLASKPLPVTFTASPTPPEAGEMTILELTLNSCVVVLLCDAEIV